MKILQLIDSLDTGGAEMMSVNISNALLLDGKAVFLCASRKGGALTQRIDPKVTYFCLNKRNSLDAVAFWELYKRVKKEKINLIHAHSSSVFWAMLVKFLTLGKTKVLWHDHFGNRIFEKANIFMVISSLFIDYVICVNEELKNWADRSLVLDKKRIAYINNFPSLKLSRLQPLDFWDTPKIAYLASFRVPKNHLNLIKAFEIFQNQVDFRPVLILAGRYQQDEYFKAVKEYITQRGLTDTIEILGDVANVGELLGEVHAGIIASDFEGLPVSLLEYGQAGLPVIVTNVGQCGLVVNHGEFGKIVEKNNPESMAAGLTALFSNWEEAVRMGSKFKAHIEKKYGMVNFLTKYYHLLDMKND